MISRVNGCKTLVLPVNARDIKTDLEQFKVKAILLIT